MNECSVTPLKVAETASKDDLLYLLDQMRQEVESGETLSIISIAVQPDRRFRVRSTGSLSMIQIIGYLNVALLDATMEVQRG